jgi:hypothetical protein
LKPIVYSLFKIVANSEVTRFGVVIMV